MSARDKFKVRGAGKSPAAGGDFRAPIEAPDSLRSRQYARVLDLVSEGEIEGLVNGLQSIYLNGTPLQNEDGTMNFRGVTLHARVGTPDQDPIPGWPAAENEVQVATQVKYEQPITRSIVNTQVNSCRVTVGVPALTTQDTTTGDLNGARVRLEIHLQNDGGGFQPLMIGTTTIDLTYSGPNADSAGVDIIAALINIKWSGDKPPLPSDALSWHIMSLTPLPKQVCKWRFEYRAVGAPDWIAAKSGTFSGTGTRTRKLVGQDEGPDLYEYTTTAPWDHDQVALDLVEGPYEFRVVLVSGVGALKLVGTATIRRTNDVIDGKTTTKYQREYSFPLPDPGPWEVRVVRITEDSASVTLQNDLFWDSYTEIIEGQYAYPHSALVGLEVDAEQFSNIPVRGYGLRGVHCQIPSNYDPYTREYTGVWDGTFETGWTNNPAWLFYEVCRNERWSVGQFIDVQQINKWALYEIAQYCDELVPDGFGGMEPRFTCALYLQTREEAYRVLTALASIFRGMQFWADGTVNVVADKPEDAVALFTPANVIDGMFHYEGASAKARHTVVMVTWNNPDDLYRAAVEYVAFEEEVARFGYLEAGIVAVGCTSRGQANRCGRWLLQTERMSEITRFRAGLDAAAIYPGAVIKTQDPYRSGVRLGGRIFSATVSALTIDSPVDIEVGENYEVSVLLPDGSIESRAITNVPGVTSVLTLATDLSAVPVDAAIWVLAATNVEPEQWRVIAIGETGGDAGKIEAEITAVAHNPGKFDLIEQDLQLTPIDSSVLQAIYTVTNLTAVESLYLVSPVVVGARVNLSWTGQAPRYIVTWWRENDSMHTAEVFLPGHTINGIEAGDWNFSVRPAGIMGPSGQAATLEQTIYGLRPAPANVQNFALSAIAGTAHLSFDAAPDLDVVVGGSLRVRFTPELDAPDWNNAMDIATQIPGAATLATVPLMQGSYLAKWIDSSDPPNESPDAAIVSTTAPSVMALNVAELLEQHPTFAGDKTNVAVGGFGLVLTSATTIGDRLDPVSEWPLISALGLISTTGTYEFDDLIDLGGVQTARVTGIMKTIGIDLLDKISMRPMVSSWPSVTGALINDVGADLYISTTVDDPLDEPAWTPWARFAIGDRTFWGARFKVDLWTAYETHNIAVAELAVQVDMPDRIESDSDVASGAGVKSISYLRPFKVIPAVGITAQDMHTGDFYELGNKSESGFDITFRNAAGTAVSRTFDHISKGY